MMEWLALIGMFMTFVCGVLIGHEWGGVEWYREKEHQREVNEFMTEWYAGGQD